VTGRVVAVRDRPGCDDCEECCDCCLDIPDGNPVVVVQLDGEDTRDQRDASIALHMAGRVRIVIEADR
jgi:hypothetical protein